MNEPREAVQAPAVSGRSPNSKTEWLNGSLRASLSLCPPSSLRRLVDDEPPAELHDSEIGPELGPTEEHIRTQLMATLLCAARNLAAAQIRARYGESGSFLYCGECREHVSSDFLASAANHHQGCRAGLVLAILAKLAALPAVTAKFHRCEACGLTDGAWVSEEMTPLRAKALGLAENQRREDLDAETVRVFTHLCIDHHHPSDVDLSQGTPGKFRGEA